jgi:aminoglycoside 3'-phosphotransferase-2
MSLDDADEDDARAVLDGLDLPIDWRIRLAGSSPRLMTIGKSGAVVVRFDSEDRPTLFLKADSGPFAEVPDEAARLEWMAAQGLPGPRILDLIAKRDTNILLMSAVPGRDLASNPGLTPLEIARIVGEALRALHSHDPATCPFDHRIANRVPVAELHLRAGHILWENDALTPEAAWAELIATQPASEDLVVTHGDASLPNLLAADWRFTGFVDCARLGLADRWQDLTLALRSLKKNYGAGLAEPFLAAYGVSEIDGPRSTWYNLLDEFF